MKASLFLLVFFLIVARPAYAQVYVGPIAGGQLSWTKFDEGKYYDSYDVGPRWGWHAGANVSMKVRNRFFLHTSILYMTKGRKITGVEDRLLTNKTRYDYIEMPIIYAVDFRGHIGSGKEFKYYVGVGPNVSYWLGGKGALYNSDLAESTEFVGRDLEYRIVFKDDGGDGMAEDMYVADPNRIQLGLTVASGLVLEPMPHQRILLMMRYELGHSFLSRTSNGLFSPTYYEDVLQARNQGIRLSVSYMVDLRIEDRKRGKSTIRQKKMK